MRGPTRRARMSPDAISRRIVLGEQSTISANVLTETKAGVDVLLCVRDDGMATASLLWGVVSVGPDLKLWRVWGPAPI